VLLTLTSLSGYAQTYKVTFQLEQLPPKPAVEQVFIAGHFNNWNPSSEQFKLSLNQPLILNLPEGIYEYKLCRGSWTTVETRTGGKPAINRALKVQRDTVIHLTVQDWQDNYPPPVKVHTASRQVQLFDTSMYISQLKRTRAIRLYLPKSYTSSTKRYPVIYMHDGQNLFDAYTSSYGEWGVDEVLDSLAGENLPEAIIVGIDHGDKYRMTEYNAYDTKQFGKGEGDAYLDFLVNTLKPLIDKKFRTLKDKSHTSIAGSSMGGLISLYAMTKYPQVFGSAGVFSPAFWLSPEINKAVTGKKFSNNRVYFIAGGLESKEMVPDMKRVFQNLKSSNPKNDLVLKVAEDGRHSEWFWHREFPDFFKWLVQK